MGLGSPEVKRYIDAFDGDVRKRLEVMRMLVAKAAPQADEGIMYGLVGYKLGGKPLIYFGAFKDHVGLYATPNTHENFAQEFAQYKQGKGSVQFPHDRPLPIDLIKRVIAYRKQQLEGE